VTTLFAAPELRAKMGSIGKAAVDENRGSLEKLLALIGPLIKGGP
jgi:hypothetical protein